MDLRVREAEDRDAAALAVLLSEFSGLETTADQARARLQRCRGVELCLLAELGGRVVGFATLRCVHYLGEDAPHAELSDLYVRPASRMQGAADALLTALEARAKASGASGWSVIVDPANDAARSLYQKHGFATFAIAMQKWFSDERPFRPVTPERS